MLAVLTFEDAPPANPDSPRDLPAIALAAVGCVAAFFGASQLTSHRFLDPVVIVPLLGGLAAIVILVVYQYRAKRPLLTIRTMLTSTIPVAGIAVALFAAAASVSATVLTAAALAGHYSPLRIGVLYLPEVAGAVITAVVLGLVITKRAMHYLPLAGMVFLAAGILVFAVNVPSSQAATLVGSGLTGIGLGATVAPALFVAGFSLPSANLQRVFAIVELLRAVAAFMVAPIFVYFAANVGSSPDVGTQIALWIGFGLAVAGALVGVALYALGGARPQTPDLERFLAGERPAWYSPPLLARVRTTHCHDTGRDRKRRLTWHPQAPKPRSPDPSSSPTTAPSSPNSRSSKPAISSRPAATALVLCVWQPADVGFLPVDDRHFDAQNATEVQEAAQQTAAHGASLAEKAGFQSQSIAVEAAPTWKGIVEDRRGAQRKPDRARLPPPQRASSGTCSAASPPPSSPTQQPPCSSCTSDPELPRASRGSRAPPADFFSNSPPTWEHTRSPPRSQKTMPTSATSARDARL